MEVRKTEVALKEFLQVDENLEIANIELFWGNIGKDWIFDITEDIDQKVAGDCGE